MENPWKIHGKSMENKTEKKGNVSLVLHGDQKGPMETGIRFDTKWHHMAPNSLLKKQISIIFRRASFFIFHEKQDLGFLGQKRRIGEKLEVLKARKMILVVFLTFLSTK